MNRSFLLFAGSSHKKLAQEIAQSLGTELGRILIERFPDGEVGVQILENVMDRDVFIVQSAAGNPDHYLMELLIIADALKRSAARTILGILPYYPYARQDRQVKGQEAITARLVADLLERAGVRRIITMDLHTEQIQGFFNIPVDNLSSRPLVVKELKKLDLAHSVLVSADLGRNRVARKYAEDLKLDLAIVDKRRGSANRVEGCGMIGNVKGKQAILIDDIRSTGLTLKTAAKLCKDQGANSVIAVVTHDLQGGKEKGEGIDQMWITNTVPCAPKLSSHVQVVSVATLFAEAIDSIASARLLSALN